MNLAERLRADILTLNEYIWEQRAPGGAIDAWLANFTGTTGTLAEEQLQALYLLSRFLYLGDREIRELLRVTYRDLYQYPIIKTIRQTNNDSLDELLIKEKLRIARKATRFLGVGNPSESGSHLLYYFRQENRLSKEMFLSPHAIFEPGRSHGPRLKDPNINHYVFLDDFAGSGTQAKEYSDEILNDLFAAAKVTGVAVSCSYLPLVARTSALEYIRDNTAFNRVESAVQLDDTYLAFGTTSRYFRSPPSGIDRVLAQQIFRHYGGVLWPDWPVGYRDGQLLLGFHHNTPDNTLTAVWYQHEGSAWQPIFARYPKR